MWLDNVFNSHLKKVIREIDVALMHARSSEDVQEAVQKAVDYGQPLVYKLRGMYLISASLIALGGSIIAASIFDIRIEFLPQKRHFLAVIAIAAGTFLLFHSRKKNKKLIDLARRAYDLDAILDNGLMIQTLPNAHHMEERFFEFQRGNYQRSFRRYIQGDYKGEEHQFTFQYFHFHYVNERIEHTTTSDGKGGSRTSRRKVYDHFDRYGFIVPFPFIKNVHLMSDKLRSPYKEKYLADSLIFRELFTVLSAEQFQAAKLLKPANIIAIEDMSKTLKSINIEINAFGDLCLSFRNSDIVSKEQQFDFKNPEAFYNEIKGHTKLNTFWQVLDFIHHLMKHSDTNF